MNYIMRGLVDLRYTFPLGILIYAAFFLLMYVLKKAKRYFVEMRSRAYFLYLWSIAHKAGWYLFFAF